MANLLRQGLEEENHTVAIARDGSEALAAAETSEFDAIVLDVMLPRMSGIEITKRLRAGKNPVPILMLTARDASSDVIQGLDSGADDYLVKPFAFGVLLARLRALSRRPHAAPMRREVPLTATEFRILEFLLRNAGRAESRTAIIEAVWGFNEDVEPNTVDVYIKSLRDKLEPGGQKKFIQTVRGYGYVIRA